jgi:hypothetical protein
MRSAAERLSLAVVVDTLARGARVQVRVISASMGPLIRPGDELVLGPLDGRGASCGMLVACSRDGRIVVHRIITCGPAGVVTKGDALTSPDALVPWDTVLGRVVAVLTGPGRSARLDGWLRCTCARLLGICALAATRLVACTPDGALLPSSRARLTWTALRLPFHLARPLFR